MFRCSQIQDVQMFKCQTDVQMSRKKTLGFGVWSDMICLLMTGIRNFGRYLPYLLLSTQHKHTSACFFLLEAPHVRPAFKYLPIERNTSAEEWPKLWRQFGTGRGGIPHICHFFTQARFLENKIYTEECVNYDKRISRQNSVNRDLSLCDITQRVSNYYTIKCQFFTFNLEKITQTKCALTLSV